jgi:DNA-binding protein YbaB
MNGRQEVLACRIDPQLYEQQDREMVEELTVAAVNQALEKARALNAEEMNKMLGGLQIPGLSEALQQFNPSG